VKRVERESARPPIPAGLSFYSPLFYDDWLTEIEMASVPREEAERVARHRHHAARCAWEQTHPHPASVPVVYQGQRRAVARRAMPPALAEARAFLMGGTFVWRAGHQG
jgi:hypothetical protein